MKTVILAGGRGSRLSEMTHEIPKPMVKIGGEPMLYHIMGIYAKYGYTDFIIAGGYKMDVIGDWLDKSPIPYKVELVDTGLNTQTGGRLKRLQARISGEFFLTYGDGLTSQSINHLLAIHRHQCAVATMTLVHPKPRFGRALVEGNRITQFAEKGEVGEWMNGGYMVMDDRIFRHIDGDDDPLESGALSLLARIDELAPFYHEGYWHCVDTLRDLEEAEKDWRAGAWG